MYFNLGNPVRYCQAALREAIRSGFKVDRVARAGASSVQAATQPRRATFDGGPMNPVLSAYQRCFGSWFARKP